VKRQKISNPGQDPIDYESWTAWRSPTYRCDMRTVHRPRCNWYVMITDGMYLLLNAAQRESLHKPEADDDDGDENQSIF